MLQPHDAHWETVINTMMEGLMVVNPDGVIVAANQAMERITGYTREELIGSPCAILNCDTCIGQRPSDTNQQCNLFRSGEVRRIKCTLTRKDGTPLRFLKNAVILRNEQGEAVGGVETLTDLTEVLARDQVINRLRRELSREDGFQGIIGKSPVMMQVFELIESAARSEAPVIIYGESGTGKELVAEAVHRLSLRRKGPFVKVNSAALNESLLESELFGHVKGAFTGADRNRVGRFEAAHGGSMFLDEIGDLPLATQAKLLRVLQEKVIEKVGDQRPIEVDVRIITATNQDLDRLMAQGSFRDDLYYRIGVIPIVLPPLRERPADIPLLVETFIERASLKTDKPITAMSKEALELIMQYAWPGNVRELINVIDFAFVLCPGGQILPQHLPTQLHRKPHPGGKNSRARDRISQAEQRERVIQALAEAGGKKSAAAKILGVSRVTLWKWLKDYDFKVEHVIRSGAEA
jgi:two-component system response regulator HydG